MATTALAIANPPTRSLGAQLVLVRSPNARRRFLWRHFFPSACLFMALVFQLWVRLSIVEKSYHLEQLRSHALELDVKVRSLKLDEAFLTRPQLIVDRAYKTLGMQISVPMQIRKLPMDTSIVAGKGK